MTEVYAVLDGDFEVEALAADLYAHFRAHEASEIARIQAMLGLFESRECLSRRLALYFGDEHAPERCGHCSVCQAA